MNEHDPNAPAPPVPPNPHVDAAGTTFVETLFESPPRRRPGRYIAVLIGLLAMVAGGVFFARSFSSSAGGADSPDAAVRSFFDALNNEDVLGVLEALPPSERDTLRSSLQQITSELSRLGVLAPNVNLSDLSGIELSFTNLQLVSTEVASGVTNVSVRSGRSAYRVDPATSPLGDFVRGLLPDDVMKTIEGTDDLADDEITFTTVKEGDRWYVSLWYSIAEAARGSGPAPPFGRGLPAKGAATPEKAVEDLIRAAIALDLRHVIELTPADEARVLHDYAPLFLPSVEAGAAEIRGAFSAVIRDLKLSSRREGDKAVVKIDDISFRVEIPDLQMLIDYDGECLTIEGGEFLGGGGPQRQCGQGITPAAGLPGIPTPDIGFVTVERGGEWFVSPTRTLLDGLIGVLKAFDRNTLEMIKQLFMSFAGLGETSMPVPMTN